MRKWEKIDWLIVRKKTREFCSRALPIDRATSREKGQPLCMEQYYRLFSCYRMPDAKQDRLIQLRNSKVIHHQVEHVIVAYRNQFFVLNVVINFTRLDEDDIYTLLRRIVQMADDDPWATDEVGIYTSLPRRTWANIRTELMKGMWKAIDADKSPADESFL